MATNSTSNRIRPRVPRDQFLYFLEIAHQLANDATTTRSIFFAKAPLKIEAAHGTYQGIEPPTAPKVTADASVGTDPVTPRPKLSPAQPSQHASSKSYAQSLGSTAQPPPKLTRQPQTYHPAKPTAPQARPQDPVRLVAHIAGISEPFSCDGIRRWKTSPTCAYQTLTRSFKRSATGCVPLGFHRSRKCNLVIAFAPSTPRHILMSNLAIVRTAFELDDSINITFDTPWSTIHLANVPARPNSGASVFPQDELIESLFANPSISPLTLTSHPRWLRKPDSITGPRSSVVFSFEDPDGTIARRLLKTPIYIFGAPVTVKPWLSQPAAKTRNSSPDALEDDMVPT